MKQQGRKKIRNAAAERRKLNQPRAAALRGWREWAAASDEKKKRARDLRVAGVSLLIAATGAFYALTSSALLSRTLALMAAASSIGVAAAIAAITTAFASPLTTKQDDAGNTTKRTSSSTSNRHSKRGACSSHDAICSTSTMMFQISRLVEALQTVRRSVLDYSYAASDHAALLLANDDGATVERLKEQHVSSSSESGPIVIAQAFQPQDFLVAQHDDDDDAGHLDGDDTQQQQQDQEQPQHEPPPPVQLSPEKPKLKKKRRTRGRAESMYTSTVTIEEFTVLPARARRSSIACFDEYMDVPERYQSFVTIEEYTVLPARRPSAITTPTVPADPVHEAVPESVAKSVPVPVTEQELATEPAAPVVADAESAPLPQMPTPKKSRTRRRSKSVRTDSLEPAAAAPTETATTAPATTTDVQQEAPLHVVETMAVAVTTAPVEDDAEAEEQPQDSALPKPRRRRGSRRRSRAHRSALSLPERLSCYDEFLLLEPVLTKRAMTLPTTVADKNHAMYVAEAARVRALQASQLPIATANITTPAIRLMVDEVNTQVARTHEALAANWDFLASLTPVVDLASETSSLTTGSGSEGVYSRNRKHEPALSLDSTEVDDDEDALRYSELDGDMDVVDVDGIDDDEEEDAHYGDVDYDDHYYAYHSMSTPCV